MKIGIATVAAAAVILLVAPSVTAQNRAQASPSRNKEHVVRELIQITGSAKLGVQMMAQMRPVLQKAMPDLPESFWDEFMAEVRSDEMVDLLVPIYSKHFALEELEQLIAFYKTPIGQKVIDAMPVVMAESMAAGQEWGRQLGQRAYWKAEARRSKTPSEQ